MQRSLGILALCVGCGSAVQQLAPALAVDRSTVDFTTDAPGNASAETLVRLSNSGGQPTGAIATALTGQDSGSFAITADACAGQSLAPAASCEIHLVFRPPEEGQRAAELRLTAGSVAASVALAGRIEGSARLAISSPAHSFAGVEVGHSATAVLTLSNSGPSPSTILSIDPSGDTGSFVVAGDCIGRALAPSGSCELQVMFVPQTIGVKVLSLAVSASRSSAVQATFDGYGTRLVTLTVSTEGDGQVLVSGTPLSCTAQPCRLPFSIGGPAAKASLTAKAGSRSLFAQWSGDCSGTANSCEVAIDGDRSVLARFDPAAMLTVDATVLAGGGGVLQVTPGSSCEAPCSAAGLVRLGSPVRLAAIARIQSQFRWTGACRGTSATCDLAPGADVHVGLVINGANYAFVTSLAYPTNLGLAGYDAACNERASAAGLPGPYVAWLATKAAPAWSRVGSARGFIRVDGQPFADTLAPGGAVYFPLSLDESGHERNPFVRLAMTGTGLFSDTDPTANCSDWTVADNSTPLRLGDPLTGAGAWTGWAGSGCYGRWLVYCMGTAIDRPLQREAAAGRLAFVSMRAIPSGGGIGTADFLCGSEARDAGLQGSFKALLPVDGASAASRFDLGGERWVRPDGVPVVEKAADLAKGTLVAPIDQHASGAYDFEYNLVWAGAATPGGVGTAANTCASWTSTDWGSYTSAAIDVTSESNWFGGGWVPCNAWGRVICLQE